MKQTKFNIGDKVEVTNSGKSYLTYDEMADHMKLTRWENGRQIYNGTQVTIIAVEPHLDYTKTIICGVETEFGEQFLMGETGLGLVERCINITPNQEVK